LPGSAVATGGAAPLLPAGGAPEHAAPSSATTTIPRICMTPIEPGRPGL
jgi:hypothetical protein